MENEWGQTPLMFAAARNRVEAMRVLIERGADIELRSRVVDIPTRSQVDRGRRTTS